MRRAIPAIISIDVEPAGFQDTRASRSTHGVTALIELIDELRPRFASATKAPPAFGWFLRMDPQIASLYGSADHLATAFRSELEELRGAGDHFGLHTHPLRWDESGSCWVHDIADPAWLRQAFASSFAAFERRFGEPCRRHRTGAGLFTQHIASILRDVGARVDTSLEPIRSWGVGGHEIPTGIDASPLSGLDEDRSMVPRGAYFPRCEDFRQAGFDTAGLALVPLTNTWLSPSGSAWRTIAGAAARRRRPRVRVLYPAEAADPLSFWDMVERSLRWMRRPYVNIALRTDEPGSRQLEASRRTLEALADHRLLRRLTIVDPLVALPSLVRGRTQPQAA